jgi:hypothetical protein
MSGPYEIRGRGLPDIKYRIIREALKRLRRVRVDRTAVCKLRGFARHASRSPWFPDKG